MTPTAPILSAHPSDVARPERRKDALRRQVFERLHAVDQCDESWAGRDWTNRAIDSFWPLIESAERRAEEAESARDINFDTCARLERDLKAAEAQLMVMRTALEPFAASVELASIEEGGWSINTAGPCDDDWKRAYDTINPQGEKA